MKRTWEIFRWNELSMNVTCRGNDLSMPIRSTNWSPSRKRLKLNVSQCQSRFHVFYWDVQVFDDLIFAFFALEMCIKVLAMGFMGKNAYLAEAWNRLDFFIVVAGWDLPLYASLRRSGFARSSISARFDQHLLENKPVVLDRTRHPPEASAVRRVDARSLSAFGSDWSPRWLDASPSRTMTQHSCPIRARRWPPLAGEWRSSTRALLSLYVKARNAFSAISHVQNVVHPSARPSAHFPISLAGNLLSRGLYTK